MIWKIGTQRTWNLKLKGNYEEIVNWDAMLNDFKWNDHKTWIQGTRKVNQNEIWFRVQVKGDVDKSLNLNNAIGI